MLTFANGDQLRGELQHADSKQVTLKTDAAGEVNVPWEKLSALTSSRAMAVLTKDNAVYEAPIRADSHHLTVQSTPEHSIAVDNIEAMVSDDTYRKQQAPEPFTKGWTGLLSAGINLVKATQTARAYNGSIALTRQRPSIEALPPRSNTLLSFQGSYGKVSQPGIPTVKTDIYNAKAEQDEYFARRLFGFGSATFDHNFAQGLSLQQAYGGGLGWNLIHTDNSQFDVKGDLHYTRQAFVGGITNNLIASTFSESYMRKLRSALVWTETVGASPSFNMSSAYQISGTTSLVVPISKRISMNTSVIDSYLGNPPLGFKKNSLQFNSGVQLTFK